MGKPEAISKRCLNQRKSRLATGGDPQEIEASVDSDILNIAPHLMDLGE